MKIDGEELQVLKASKLTNISLSKDECSQKEAEFEDEKLFKDYVLIFDQEKMS